MLKLEAATLNLLGILLLLKKFNLTDPSTEEKLKILYLQGLIKRNQIRKIYFEKRKLFEKNALNKIKFQKNPIDPIVSQRRDQIRTMCFIIIVDIDRAVFDIL